MKPKFKLEDASVGEVGIAKVISAISLRDRKERGGDATFTPSACGCDSETQCDCNKQCGCETYKECKHCRCVSDCRCDNYCGCERQLCHCENDCKCEYDCFQYAPPSCGCENYSCSAGG